MRTTRNRALLLATIMIASSIALMPAPNAGAQDSGDSNVPVPFAPTSLKQADLHLYREGGGDSDGATCTANQTTQQVGGQTISDTGFCNARITPPSSAQGVTGANPDEEQRPMRDDSGGALGGVGGETDPADTIVKWVMDTDGPGGLRGQGAEFPFTVKGGANAIQYQVWVDTDATCANADDNPINLTMQLRRANEGAPFQGSIVKRTRTTTQFFDCDSGLSQNSAQLVTQSITLSSPLKVKANETLIVEMFGTVPPGSTGDNIAFFFEETNYDSKVVLRTDQVVEQAAWATDRTGTVTSTFDPNADATDRVMTGRMALRSPFGAAAVPSNAFTGQIENPDGTTVDLFPDTDQKDATIGYDTVSGLTSNHGAKKIYRFAKQDDTRPWHYPEGVQTGPYTIRALGSVLADRSLDIPTTVAMGSFNFQLSPITEESTNHDLVSGTSTTFLLRLANNGINQDVYEVDTSFEFAEGGGQWGVDVIGADQNDRVSLNPGESALIRVTLTPPGDATAGDAARVNVTATSTASDTTKSLELQGTITQQTSREVRVLVFREDPFTVGVNRTTEINVFAWNKGTAPDSVRASFVEGSFDPADTDQFSARLPQRTFEGITPGSVTSIPIEVTTTDQVARDQNLTFNIRLASQNVPEETDQAEVVSVVEAVRNYNVLALDGRNDEALESTRFGKFNITDQVGGGGPGGGGAPACESQEDTSSFYDRNCRDYTNWTFHRFVLENTGDLTETFDLSLVGGVNVTEHFDAEAPDDQDTCTPVLRDHRFNEEDTGFVSAIDHDDPGTDDVEIDQLDVPAGQSRVFYLRVAYDGQTPLWNDVGSGSECLWESYEPSVRIGLTDSVQTKFLDTTTKVYSVHPSDEEMEKGAKARLALEDSVQRNGTLVDTPTFTGIQPGTNDTMPFTVSLQSGHYDPVNLTLEPRNIVEDLREDGWTLEIVPLSTDGVERTDGGILYPATAGLGASHDGPEAFHHESGGDFEAGLKVGPPKTGVQENIRHTFTIAASSTQVPTVRDTLGLGVQVGQDFAFEIDEGTTEVDATQGDTVAFALSIENTGASRDTYHVDASVSPGSFGTPSIRSETVEVSPGSAKTVSIAVDVPQGAQSGTPATVDVEVTAEAGTDDTADDLGPKTAAYTVNVRSQGTLSITGPSDDVRIGPGGQNALNFTITNDQNTQRTLTVAEVLRPAGFSTTLSETNSTIEINPQSSRTFTYVIEAPDDIVKGSVFPFTLRVEDANDDSDFATGTGHAIVIGQTAIQLTAEENRNVVDRGGNTTFPVLVENPGTQPAVYNLRTEFQSAGWSARIIDADGNTFDEDQVRVPEKTFERVIVDVQAPDEVAEGHVESVTLSATAEGNTSVRDEITLSAPIHDYAVSIDVDGPTTKPAVPGDDLEYTVSITNAGNGEDTIALSFEDLDGDDPLWSASSELSGDTTPRLAPGETLEDVTIEVHVPGPGEGPVPVPDGVTTVVRATSSGQLPDAGSPTATTQIVTRLVKYQRFDVDDDGALEMGVDLNRDATDGFEAFADRDSTLIERGVLDADAAKRSEGLYTLDGDDDDRIEHLVDTDRDGIAEKYFDPDRAQAYTVPYTVDVNGDGQPDHPIDSDFDGRIDGVYDAASESVHATVHLDFSGDGRRDLLVDANDDTFYDTFVDPNQSPALVTPVDRDGDVYRLDTDGDGDADTHFNVATGEISDARTANLGDFLAQYWWFLVVFIVVVGLFGVIVYRRL